MTLQLLPIGPLTGLFQLIEHSDLTVLRFQDRPQGHFSCISRIGVSDPVVWNDLSALIACVTIGLD